MSDDTWDDTYSCACCERPLAPFAESVNYVRLLEVVYGCDGDEDGFVTSFELLVTTDDEPVYDPIFLAESCHEEMIAHLHEALRHPDLPPHKPMRMATGSTCATCDFCGGLIDIHDNAVRITAGVLRGGRRGITLFEADGTPPAYMCLPCALVINGAIFEDYLEAFGLWDELNHEDECVECTYTACHHNAATNDLGCDCPCHADEDEDEEEGA